MRMQPPRRDPDAIRRYVRHARRLRHELRRSPARLHRRLRDLDATAETPTRSINAGRPVPLARSTSRVSGLDPAQQLAAAVALALDGCVLRYSRRVILLDHAQKLGIGRFEANLIIATVQHQAGHRPIAGACLIEPATARKTMPIHPWVVVAFVQLVIVSLTLYAWACWV